MHFGCGHCPNAMTWKESIAASFFTTVRIFDESVADDLVHLS